LWGDYENKSGIESVSDTLRVLLYPFHIFKNKQSKKVSRVYYTNTRKNFALDILFPFFSYFAWTGTKIHSERVSANWINISIAIKYLCVFWRYNFYDRRQWRWNSIFLLLFYLLYSQIRFVQLWIWKQDNDNQIKRIFFPLVPFKLSLLDLLKWIFIHINNVQISI